MRGIFGLFHRDGRVVDRHVLAAMQRRMHGAASSHATIGGRGACRLGQLSPVREARLPASAPEAWVPPRQLTFAVAARLDARPELCDALEIRPGDDEATSDAELIQRAYVRWGDASPARLLGDWAFAVWHEDERRLFVARDQQGAGTVYTFVDDRHVAFASTLAALLVVPGLSPRLDELHCARLLTAWQSSETTCYADISRLPLSHALTATPDAIERRRYFDLSAVEPLRLPSDEDYIEACREIFTRAVADRLRTSRSAAVALSGGLDSGAVAVTAARLRGPRGPAIGAISHVPQFRDVDLRGQIADEEPYALATARAAGLAPVTCLDSARLTPIGGMRQALEILGSPIYAAANLFWLLDLLAMARELGYDTLLTGELGNLTFSWTWPAHRGRWHALWRGPHRRAALVELLPPAWTRRVRAWRRRAKGPEPWRAYSAIHPDLARRLRLTERMADEAHDPLFERERETAFSSRVRMLRTSKGEFAEAGLAAGVPVCDPTADLRLVRFCLSLPDEQFVGPRGERRWLVRRLMAGALPAEVLWSRRRGRQASDLALRLTASAAEVEEALTSCEASPRAAEIVDVPYLRSTWGAIRGRADTASQQRAVAILARGLVTGLFLASCDAGIVE